MSDEPMPMHILVVDDSADDQNMYAFYLSKKGCEVSKAGDGQEALEKAIDLQPDLILLDLWLPVMSGWELMTSLKANARTRDIPILVVTGHSTVPPLECAGFLIKPFSLVQLSAEIARILEPRRSPQGISQSAG